MGNQQKLVDFFEKSQAVYQLEPWKYCADSDVFGVLVNETQELHFVSVMGGAKQCFGLATYRGIAGLDLYLAILDGLYEVDPTLVQRRQDGLLLEFVDQEYLDAGDLQFCRQGHLTAVNGKSWPYLREFARGWSPGRPAEKDLEALKVIFSVLPSLIDLQKQDPTWSGKRGRNTFPVFTRSTANEPWQWSWWSDEQIVKTCERLETSCGRVPLDESRLQQAKSLQKKEAAIWEAYSFYAPHAEDSSGRPFYPEVCVIMDRQTEKCLAREIIQPNQNRSGVLRDLALQSMCAQQLLPTGIVIEETELLKEMLDLKRVLNVEFKINAAKFGRQFEVAMFENAKVRTLS